MATFSERVKSLLTADERSVFARLSSPKKIQDFVDAVPFFTAIPVVQKVCVVNHLSDHRYSWVANMKVFFERLERAVAAPVTKAAFLKHVVRYGSGGYAMFRRKRETTFRVDKAPN